MSASSSNMSSQLHPRTAAAANPSEKSSNVPKSFTVPTSGSHRHEMSDNFEVNLTQGFHKLVNVLSGRSKPITLPEKPVPDETQNKKSPNDNEGWLKLVLEFRAFDEKMVKDWNDQIDTLLVLAGLFSAVVTAFNVEIYKQLLPDPLQISNNLLLQLSIQISQLPAALTNTSFHLPPPQTIASQFQVSRSAIVINGLWYTSLVLSLIAASLGMLVKQWLKQYLAEDYSPPRQRARVREHRWQGLRHWLVPHIIALLPLLIRIALTLFLVGLIIFLKTLHPAVMLAVAVPVAVWLGAYAGSIVLPTAFMGCPYKSPEAAIFYRLSRIFTEGFRPAIVGRRYITWSYRENPIRDNGGLDFSVLATADLLFSDSTLDNCTRQCVKGIPFMSVMDLIGLMINHRSAKQQLSWATMSPGDPVFARITQKSIEIFIHMIIDSAKQEIDNFRVDNRRASMHASGRTQLTSLAVDIRSALHFISYFIRTSDWGENTTFDTPVVELLMVALQKATQIALNVVEPAVLTVLSARPQLCQSQLAFALPDLCSAAFYMADSSENFLSEIPSCLAILSLALLHDSPAEKIQFRHLISAYSSLLASGVPAHWGDRNATIASLNKCMERTAELRTRTPLLLDSFYQGLEQYYKLMLAFA